MEKNKLQGLMQKATIEWEKEIEDLSKELKEKDIELINWKKRCHKLSTELGIVKQNNEKLEKKIKQLEAQIEKDNISKWEHPSMSSKLDIKVTKW